jgi:hypothetical protein
LLGRRRLWVEASAVSMGLVVSIFAYLCSITIIVVTLLTSFGAALYPPDQTTIAQPTAQQTTATVAKSRTARATSGPWAGNERSGAPPAKKAATDVSNSTAQQPHARRLVRQARAKDWLHQSEPRVFGYAEDPSASFLYDRFQ